MYFVKLIVLFTINLKDRPSRSPNSYIVRSGLPLNFQTLITITGSNIMLTYYK